jgi:ribosomal protein S18 acetylase RimI-like enzyme
VAIEIKPVSGYHDLERWVAARNEAIPDDPQNAVMMALVRATELGHVDLLALEGDEVVGTGLLAGDRKSEASSHPLVEVTVPALHRGRGVGTALLRAFSEHLRKLGKEGMECDTRAHDEESVRFLRRRGFVELRRIPQVALDLDGPVPEVDRPPGLETAWFSDRPDLLEGLYRVAAKTYGDFGPYVAEQARTLNEWQAYELGNPDLLLELLPVALAGGEVIGFSTVLKLIDPDAAVHRLTAVLREWRPAVTTSLLAAIVAAAPGAGLRRLTAWLRGEEMTRSFVELGYRLSQEAIVFRGPLQD